jgi:hypothetical protein
MLAEDEEKFVTLARRKILQNKKGSVVAYNPLIV